MQGLSRIAPACALMLAAMLLTTNHSKASGAAISFTATQASAGASAFAAKCALCHGAQLEGGAGPALSGPNFKTLSTKVKANVSDIFTYMTTNMPLNAPASLSHTQYVDILAFILSKNGYHPGSSALTFGQASASTAAIVKN